MSTKNPFQHTVPPPLPAPPRFLRPCMLAHHPEGSRRVTYILQKIWSSFFSVHVEKREQINLFGVWLYVHSVVWKYSVYRVIQYTSIPDSQASLCITAQIFFFTFSFFQYFIKVEIKCNIMHSYLVLRLHFHLIYRSLNSSLGCSPPAFTNSQSQISRCQFLPKSSFIEINSLNSLTYQLFRLERHI